MNFLLGLGLVTLYWPYVAAPADFPRWAMAGVVVPILLLNRRASIPLPILAFLAVAAIQGLWVIDAYRWLQNLWQLVIISMAICYGATMDRAEWQAFVQGAVVGVGVNIAVMIPQLFGWGWIPQAQPPAGLQANKNFLGEVIVIVLAASRLRWLGAISMLATAKGALVAWVIVQWASFRSWPLKIAFAVVGISAAGFILWRDWVAFPTSTIAARLTLWANSLAMVADNPMGHGGGAFWGLYPRYHDAILNWNTATYTGLIRPETPHNDLILILVEYGIIGLCLVLLIGYHAYKFRSRAPDAANALLAFAVCGFFGFPFREPATVLFAGVALGHLIWFRPVVRRDGVVGRDALLQGAVRDEFRWHASPMELR